MTVTMPVGDGFFLVSLGDPEFEVGLLVMRSVVCTQAGGPGHPLFLNSSWRQVLSTPA